MSIEKFTKDQVIIGLLLVSMLGGIMTAFYITAPIGSEKPRAARFATPIISSIAIGELEDPLEAQAINPTIVQQRSYRVGAPIVMRVTTDPTVTNPIQLTVRLKSSKGHIIPLSPSTVTFQPGTSGFCCWTIEKKDSYILQIFRPDGYLIRLPISVNRDARVSHSSR